ncbi:MAG TPA: cellulase family glycosylhydrolase [Actinotalea sp.]
MLHPSAPEHPPGDELAPGAGVGRFHHVAGGRIVDPDGHPVLLRGVGLGNWLLPEGYMWGFGASAASPRQIEAAVEEMLGAVDAERFWRGFRDRFVAEADVVAIAQAGFDHVRLPVNWRVLMTSAGGFLEAGFELVDRLIGWCREQGLTVLIDLHGAPGGQTGTNIDDSAGRPELFMDPRNEELAVALWTEIARRYRDEPAVLGYDLLNEPLPDQWQHRYSGELVALYRRLTAAVRSQDPDHLIMYEGTHWATNWDIFTEVWDPNSVLQFHKYWSPVDRAGIERFLAVGRRLGLPVYMGEGGENTPEWIAAATQLYEDCGVGWNFWTWKKIETRTSPLSVRAPDGWDRVLARVEGTAGRLDRDDAVRIFDELLENMTAARCTRHPAVLHALFRLAPLTLPAYGFTFRGAGVSYGTAAATPHPRLRADDAVTLRRRDGAPDLDFGHPARVGREGDVVADLGAGDWLAFDVELVPGEWTIAVIGEHGPGAPAVTAAGSRVTLTSRDGGAADQVWTGTYTVLERGRPEIRVTAGPDGLVLTRLRVTAAT